MPHDLSKLSFLVGSEDILKQMADVPSREPFSDDFIEFLNNFSKMLMKDSRSKNYSDVITLGFWCRKAHIRLLKERFAKSDNNLHFGRGVVFHIAPSNVPVNFAYSLIAGFIAGNANIVRVPGKDYEQVRIIVDAINAVLEKSEALKNYIVLVRYERNRELNNALSSMADIRIIWGGDATIEELRKSPLPARSTEITFADRYSFSIIDSDAYMKVGDKLALALDFYNDTYLNDQNACTSPRLIVWVGHQIEEAKEKFWELLYKLVEQKYSFQPIQGVNKLNSAYLVAAIIPGIKIIKNKDNLLIRVKVPRISHNLMDLKDNCGYFFEYDCDDIIEMKSICNDRRCQTIGMIGDIENIRPLLESGIKGVDRVVAIGKTMDFDFIWDGYDLISQLTRVISV